MKPLPALRHLHLGPPLQVGTELVNLSVIWELVLVLLFQSGNKKPLINNVCFKRNKDYRKNRSSIGCIWGQNNRAIVLENNGLLFSRTMEVNLDLLNGGISIVMLIKGSKIKGNYIQWIEDQIVMLINRSKIRGNNIQWIEDYIQWIEDQSRQGHSSKHFRVNQAMPIEKVYKNNYIVIITVESKLLWAIHPLRYNVTYSFIVDSNSKRSFKQFAIKVIQYHTKLFTLSAPDSI